MAQFARPDSDTSIGSWTGSPVNTTGNRFQNIDESSASDSDYVLSPNNPNGAGAEFGLSNVTDPTTSAGHVLRYRVAQGDADGTIPDGGGTAVQMVVTLRQGGTDIANSGTINLTGAFADGSFTLSAAEADAITDYTDLRVFLSCTGGGGSPASRRCGVASFVELEVPDAAQVVATNFISAGTTLFNPAAHLTIFANLISGTVLFNPGVLADQIIEANFISATVLYEPAVGALIEAQFISGTQLFSPTNVHQEVVANLISQTVLFSPASVQEVIVDFIDSLVSVFDPVAIHQTVSATLISNTQIFDPIVEQFIQAEFISATTVVQSPSVEQLIIAQLIGGTTLFNPSVEAAGTPQTVITLLISGTTLFAPTAIAEQFINANLISATTLVHNPDVAMVVLAVGPAVGTTVFTPGLVFDQIIVAQLLADGQLFNPSVSVESEEAPAGGPFELSTGRRINQLRRGKASGLSVLRRLGN